MKHTTTRNGAIKVLIIYILKYINKCFDRLSVVIVPSDTTTVRGKYNIDEIKQYLDCRYISPSEACRRILSYSTYGRNHVVERVFFHMEGENSSSYKYHE